MATQNANLNDNESLFPNKINFKIKISCFLIKSKIKKYVLISNLKLSSYSISRSWAKDTKAFSRHGEPFLVFEFKLSWLRKDKKKAQNKTFFLLIRNISNLGLDFQKLIFFSFLKKLYKSRWFLKIKSSFSILDNCNPIKIKFIILQ